MKYTVYTIRHNGTDMVLYVGKTKNFQRRKREHLSLNTTTKEWLEEIGTDNVLIEPVAEFDTEKDALKCEDELILKYDTTNRGYNKCRSGLIYIEDPKEYYREYEKTNKRKDYKQGYRQTDKCRKYKREWQREYRQTDKYREYHIEYRQTDKYKEYQRDYQRDYYHAKKLGITVEEYRVPKSH